jgi:Ca2+-transporting ATPase
MVLTDDAFESIVAAVEEGRITFDNIRKVTMFLIGSGVAEVLAILLAILLGWPLPLVAAQILWLNLVTDGLQDIALAFEPGEPDALDRPPRARAEGLLSRLMWERVALSGLVMGLGTLAMFRWELERGGDLVQAQTVALTTMVVFQTFQAGNARSETRSLFAMNPFANRFLFLAAGAALLVHIGALHFPPAQYVLRVEPIPLQRWAEIVAVGLLVIVAVEGHKRLRREPAGRS